MAFILSLETSSKICSAAVFNDRQLISIREEDGSYSHAENLAAFIEEVLRESNTDYSQLSAVAVSKGPGSYTGLRIGTSTAKGICYALNIPMISVPTLQSMAFLLMKNESIGNSLICPMIDARRMEVYTSVYDKNLDVVKETSAEIIDVDFMSDLLKENTIYFCGDGSIKAKETLAGIKNAVFSSAGLPSAEGIGALAFNKYQNSQFEDTAYFEPFYLKDFIAGKPKKLL